MAKERVTIERNTYRGWDLAICLNGWQSTVICEIPGEVLAEIRDRLTELLEAEK